MTLDILTNQLNHKPSFTTQTGIPQSGLRVSSVSAEPCSASPPLPPPAAAADSTAKISPAPQELARFKTAQDGERNVGLEACESFLSV